MKKIILMMLGIVAISMFLIGCSSETVQITDEEGNLVGEASRFAPNKYTLKPIAVSSVTLNTLNACTLEMAGDDDHLVDYTTFPNDGSGVCNTICKNAGKKCIEAYMMGFSSSPNNRDVATIPRLCSHGNNEYNPFDYLEGYFPMAVCRCC